MKKRRLSILLSIVMLFSLLPTTALAAGTYPKAGEVCVDGNKYFGEPGSYYFRNGESACSKDPKGSNAAYDPTTGTLTLDGYKGGSIEAGGTNADITVILKGTNTINGNLVNSRGGDITITSDSVGTLTITNTTNTYTDALVGIKAGYGGSFSTGNVTIEGNAEVTVNMTHNGTQTYDKAYGIFAKENITISENASVDITCATPNNTGVDGTLCNGLRAVKDVIIDTTGKVKIDVTRAGGSNTQSYGIFPSVKATLTNVGEMEIEWKKHDSNPSFSGAAILKGSGFDTNTHAVNVDTTNCYASYRKGTPHTVTVQNGTLTGTGVKYANESGNFLENDTVNITPNEKKSSDGTLIPFKEWTSEDVALSNPTTENNSFTVPDKNVTVTAMHSPFVGTPMFTRTSDSSGTIAFKTAVKPGDGTDYFQYVEVGKENDPYAYNRPYSQPTTISTASPYEYSVSATNYNSGNIRYLDAGEYRMAVTLNSERYLSDKFTVNYTAAPKTLDSIAVTTAPAKTTYTAGENFDPTGMVVTATYNDSSTAAVTGYTVTDGNSLTAGKTSVTISYTDGSVTKTCTQAITVNAVTPPAPVTLTGISVKTAPDKVTYNEGESFDATGMVIEATYNDGNKKDVTGYTVTDGNSLTAGKTSVTISYTDGSVTKTCTQAITVNAVTPPAPVTLTGISVKTAPDKVTYNEGDSFDKTGMVIEATYSDSSKKNVTTYTYTPTGALTTANTTISISYTEGSVTKTCTQAITVNAVMPLTPVTLTGITVKTTPTKVTYNEGESFDKTGMVIEATYSDSSKKDVTTYTYTPTGALTTANTTISISYTEGSETKTCTQAITVNAAPPAPTEYTITFNVNGGSGTIPSQNTSGQKLTSLPTATHSGSYSFAGWYTEASGGTQITTAYVFSANTTVYAHWTYTGGTSSGGSSGGGGYIPSTTPTAKPSTEPVQAGKATTSDLAADTTSKGNETSTTVSQAAADKIVDAAVKNRSEEIVISTKVKNEAAASGVKAAKLILPTTALQTIAEKTDAKLTLQTDVGQITLDNKTIAAVAAQSGSGTVSMSISKVKDAAKEVRFELQITGADGKQVSDFNGGKATIVVAVPQALSGKKIGCVYIDANAHYHKVPGKLNTDGSYTFTTEHFSSYAIMEAAAIEESIAAQKAAVKELKLKLTSKLVKSKKGKKQISLRWKNTSTMQLDGVQIYRSTKRDSGYRKKVMLTSKSSKYTDTAVKQGKKYYYKARGYVTIDGERVYTAASTKAYRTVK